MALEKAVLLNTVTGQRVVVQFNPEDYSLAREAVWSQAAVPGLGAPLLQFANGGLQTLELELLLDTYETGGDVRDSVKQITALMDIDPTIHAPPVVLFTWGSLAFTCVLARANQKFIMFRPDGIPVRARVTVTFNEFRNADLEAKEVKRETADYTKLYTVSQGETLSTIAARVYGASATWRPIAIHNGIDDPRSLDIGQRLEIPRLPFRDPETGEVMR
jgi:nucleoid-associated protein YgaU